MSNWDKIGKNFKKNKYNNSSKYSYFYTFDEKYKLEVIKASNGFETQRIFLEKEPKQIKLVKEIRNFAGSYVDEQAIGNRVYEFFKEKYHLSNIKADNVKLLENNSFILGIELVRNYLIGKYATLMEVREDVANYSVMSIEVNTHTYNIELHHNVDAIRSIQDLHITKPVDFEKFFSKRFWK